MACIDGKPCLIQEDWSLRAIVLAFQTFCMLTVFFNMLISYHYRKSKVRAMVFILYFKPSIFRCIVLRWVRMLGFAIVYGTITLKLYRILKVFLSHTAQRVAYMTSGRVLKKLALILLLVLWFLAAWTVGMLENIEKNIPLVVRSQTPRGLQFYTCDQDRWDYMMAVGSPLREEIAAEMYEDELDLRHSGSFLNSSITSTWSEHSLDPDDIRVGGTLRTFF
ncbi:putative G-protein coupled receptor [Crotalus adamanteus]|uniref:G-protein coupled receptor n=1 Tax=Crotalus adamanteus TaxID=8729 RepID=A0AAW1B4E4_CROAD